MRSYKFIIVKVPFSCFSSSTIIFVNVKCMRILTSAHKIQCNENKTVSVCTLNQSVKVKWVCITEPKILQGTSSFLCELPKKAHQNVVPCSSNISHSSRPIIPLFHASIYAYILLLHANFLEFSVLKQTAISMYKTAATPEWNNADICCQGNHL